ncbi:MAG: hypothetical protein AAB401_06215 [Acidobacteriota bacterium]
MKKKSSNHFDEDDDMLPEYDLRKMRIVKRGPGHTNPEAAKLVRVTLDPDVASTFTDDRAVNEALRTLLRLPSYQQTAS